MDVYSALFNSVVRFTFTLELLKNYANYRFPPGPCSKWLGPEAVCWTVTRSSAGGGLPAPANRSLDPEQRQLGFSLFPAARSLLL